MSVIGSEILAGASGNQGYNIQRSLRFRSSASAYLSRTPASSGNRQKWSISFWVKRGKLGSPESYPFGIQYNDGTNHQFIFAFTAGDQIGIDMITGGSYDADMKTLAVFRDPSAWYHIVLAIDTTQATAANRVQLWVNNQAQSFQGYNTTLTYPAQNYNTAWNVGSYSNQIAQANGGYFDGYLAEVNFIDGQALTPSSFGQTDAITGVWTPKKYTGTYGTNGFYLNFSDNTSATTLAYDKSGNSNNWTPNNISTTAGATYDSMTDVPTLTSSTAANYCVINAVSNGYGTTAALVPTNGNLDFSDATTTNKTCVGSMTAPSGKWYFELTCTSTGIYSVGLLDKQTNNESFYRNNGAYSSSFGGGATTGYSSWTNGDVIGVAWDADAGKLWFAKNNTWQSGSPSAGTSPTNTFTAGLSLFPDIFTDNSAGTKSGSFNFGQRPFSYTPPTGFVALNTFNLPTPTIPAGNKYMDATIYTGNGTSQSVVNAAGFQPDFVWIKLRNQAGDYHNLFDSSRGIYNRLFSNDTGAENTNNQTLTAFNSNGFSVGSNGNVNTNAINIVGWQWKESATAGFDIVTYTGNGTAGRTVSHSLGVAPSMIIVKGRSNVDNWQVGHTSVGWNGFLYFNLTNAYTATSSAWNNTAPTSTVFSLGSDTRSNGSGTTYVAYLFAEIAGFSAFGSYTGNGSADGPFVYCGFRPKYILQKRTDVSGDWRIMDTSRGTYNIVGPELQANMADAEYTENDFDIVSNGFKLRNNIAPINANGGTYIYAAFAENPFKYSNAR